MNYKNGIYIIICTSLIFIFLANIGNGLECTNCHTGNGRGVVAKDTIIIGSDTCLKCHNPDYPPIPIGYNTHLVHVGKFSVNTDFLKKHPSVAESLSCDNCHVQIFDCKNCHIKDIPHIDPPLGYNCQGCHGEIDKLFLHPSIKLKIHDIFGLGSDNKTACTMCHNPDSMTSLKLANGDTVPIEESYKLCHQCHSTYYNLWDAGSHYSYNVPKPVAGSSYDPDAFSQEDTKNNWRKQNVCTNCHNPHNPSELYQLPTKKAVDVPTPIVPNYLYILIGIAIICIIVIMLRRLKTKKIKGDKVKLPDIRKISFPSMPKTLKDLIPISISVGEIDKKDDTPEKKLDTPEKKLDTPEKKLDTPEKKLEIKPYEIKNDDISKSKIDEEKTEIDEEKTKKTEKRVFLRKHKKDILIISSIVAILCTFFIIFGAFMPIKVIASESMSPHINKGDLIFYTSIDRINDIKTYKTESKNDGYKSFDDYGEVIIYKPFGDDTIGPYVHRAMYYVEKGQEMWPGGPQAPHSGYITRGDNKGTNKEYDQQMDLSYNEPVLREWIIGTPAYRIPYIGYIRIMLP